MKITTNSWHYKVFDWWVENSESRQARRIDERRRYYDRNECNLCPYMRIVLFKAPLLWIFTPPRLWYTLGVIAAALTELNYHFHGLRGLRIEGEVIGSAVAIVAIVGGLVWSIFYIKDNVTMPTPVTSFASVTGDYVRAVHDGICPVVSFVEPTTATETQDGAPQVS